MKPVKLESFKLNASIARRIAEAMWGRDGTHSIRTNRKGVYFYDCSSHGGFVVDAEALSNEEKKKIDEHVSSDNLHLLVQDRKDGKYIIGTSVCEFSNSQNKRMKYLTELGPVEWEMYPIYIFEEDMEWCVLIHLTDVKTNNSPEEKQKKHAKEMFEQQYIRTAR